MKDRNDRGPRSARQEPDKAPELGEYDFRSDRMLALQPVSDSRGPSTFRDRLGIPPSDSPVALLWCGHCPDTDSAEIEPIPYFGTAGHG